MIRNLKALGLALCAVFAFGAFSASLASAQDVKTDVLTSGSLSGTTYLTGEQLAGTNVFSTKWKPTAKVECEKATYSGSYAGASSSSVEVTPAFSGCKAGGFAATVDEEGCKFVLTGTTDTYFNTNNEHKGEDATVHLNCEHKNEIKITAALGCTITFGDTHEGKTVNQNLLGVKYDNEKEVSTGTWDVKVTVTVDTISYTSKNCGFLGVTATDEDGTLTTNVTVRAYEDKEHKKKVNLTVS